MIPRGIRNNNPGNLRKSAAAWRGKIAGTDPDFETFDTAHNGIRATAKQLLAYEDVHGLRTVRGIINRWAPPVENNTSAYVTAVAREMNVGIDEPISTHSARTLSNLVTAIIRHENGQQPYTIPEIQAAVLDALDQQKAPQTAGIPQESRRNPAEIPRAVPVSPVSPKGSKMDPLTAIPLLAGLVRMFAPKVAAQVDKVIGTPEGAPLLSNLVKVAQEATGQDNPKAALVLAEDNPAAIAKMEAAAVDWLAQVAPLLDKMEAYERAQQSANTASMDAAGERGRKDSVDLAPTIVRYMFAIVAGALLFIFFVMGVQVWSLTTHEPTTAMLTLVGPLLGGIFGSLATIVAYRFGEKRNSSAAEASQAIAYKLAERTS